MMNEHDTHIRPVTGCQQCAQEFGPPPWPHIGREEQAVGHPGERGPTKPPRISADSRSSAVPPSVQAMGDRLIELMNENERLRDIIERLIGNMPAPAREMWRRELEQR